MCALSIFQRVSLGIGLLLFVAACAYVPWAVHKCETIVAGSRDSETWDHWIDRLDRVNVCHPLQDPPYTQYGWLWGREHKITNNKDGSYFLMWDELNVEYLLTEWLGIAIFTGGLVWLLQQGHRKA